MGAAILPLIYDVMQSGDLVVWRTGRRGTSIRADILRLRGVKQTEGS